MLECLINHYTNGNKAKFAELIGAKPQTISAWIVRETFDAEQIYAHCEGVSGDWLLSKGEGNMLSKDRQIVDASTNAELIQLCKQLVANYQQREDVMSKLVSMLR